MPMAPVIYRGPGVGIQVLNDRLVFFPRELNEKNLLGTERACCSVLRDLPHTPVTAIGVNFGFVERDPSEELLGLFNLSDVGSILQERWQMRQRKLVRKLSREESTLNLSLTLEEEEGRVDVECNFHTDTPSDQPDRSPADMASEAIDGRVLELRDTCLHLLEAVYHLQVEEVAEQGVET